MRISSHHNLQVPNFSVHALRGLLEDAGLDWRIALANADLDLEAVNRPGGTIPGKKEIAFQLQFVALTHDRVDLWIRAARFYTVGSFGIRGLAMMTAPTIEAYVNVASDATDVGPAILDLAPLRTPEGTMTGIELTYPDMPEELIAFSVYRDLCYNTQVLPWLYGGPFPFSLVEFPLPDIAPEVADQLPCPVTCGAETLRIWWDPAASTQELPFGDAFQHAAWTKEDTQILDALRATGDWPRAVAQAIRTAPESNRKLPHVATALRVSPRTLQRKLALTGHDFAQLRDDTLGDLAADLLSKTDQPITQISRTLGYADPTSFTLAFKRWKGMPPRAYRDASPHQNTTGLKG